MRQWRETSILQSKILLSKRSRQYIDTDIVKMTSQQLLSRLKLWAAKTCFVPTVPTPCQDQGIEISYDACIKRHILAPRYMIDLSA